jgi:hypothetical protein
MFSGKVGSSCTTSGTRRANQFAQSLTVKSFEKSVVLWMKSCSGKISTWLVTETNNKGKRLSSTYLMSYTNREYVYTSNTITNNYKHSLKKTTG